jgi:hypothetical protein
VSDPIASLTAEVERLAGLLRDANAEIVRLRGEPLAGFTVRLIEKMRGDGPTEPGDVVPTIVGENPGPVNMSTATAYVPEDSSTWPMMDWSPDEPNMYRWPSGRGAVWLSDGWWVAFRDTEFRSPVGLSYPTAAVAAAALRVRLPGEVVPTVTPPTTDPPRLLIGMVYETARGASMAFGADWPTPPGTFAIYDSIADYRAGRALWRR